MLGLMLVLMVTPVAFQELRAAALGGSRYDR